MSAEAYDYEAEAARLEEEQQRLLQAMQDADTAETARLDREDELDRQAAAQVDADNAWMQREIERMNAENGDSDDGGPGERPPSCHYATA